MGTGSHSAEGSLRNRASQAACAPESAFSELLKPMLAGAQARGMADMLELLGLGCIFIRSDGSLLHVSARAEDLMARTIIQAAGHLAGTTPSSRAAIDRLLAGTLAGKGCCEVVMTESHGIELQSFLPEMTGNTGIQPLYGIVTVKKIPGRFQGIP